MPLMRARTITITSADNAHGNDNLIVTTGTEALDTVDIDGAASFAGNVTISSADGGLKAALTSTGNGTVAITTDVLDISAGGIKAGTGRREIDELTAARAIHFGNNELAGELNISDTEVDLNTAGVLQVGSADAGRI